MRQSGKGSKSAHSSAHQQRSTGTEGVEAAQAKEAGAKFEWHFGRITRLGSFELGGRAVTIIWDEGGATSQQGNLSDEQWEIFKLAFLSTGRIAILSDEADEGRWMYDYRFLEVVR